MDARKTLAPAWQDLLSDLRRKGKQDAADAIEDALKKGKNVQAVQLARSLGVLPNEGSP
ncbi:MAG: hypothetical protein VYE17_06010 [Pseudomonadota bacterium]|nr:hypothetical protein [Pseudomonadota bacterium]MEE2870063.1 hypothetical protein [Pseudomonadota bacterium]